MRWLIVVFTLALTKELLSDILKTQKNYMEESSFNFGYKDCTETKTYTKKSTLLFDA